MIYITIPNNNINERKYILEIFFKEFLSLDYKLIIDEKINNWKINLENNKELIFEDYFFNKYVNNLEYLNIKNIPEDIEFDSIENNQFITKKDIPIIYGIPKVNIINNKVSKKILCGIDIFASAFFMLTRWEENINTKRDRFNRFSAFDSLSYRCDFLDRPIVNEYLEMLWNMLIYLNFDKKRKINKFDVFLTHDIDFLLMKKTPLKIFIKTIGGDILKRKNLGLAISYIKDYLKSFFSTDFDPFNTFEYLMNLSNKSNLKSYFFFMAKGQTIYDNNYSTNDKFFKRITQTIKDRGHFIGIHSTFNSYNNLKLFKEEKKELEMSTNQSINFGRQHYLRFEVPTTWQVWEDNNMKWDSSVYYPEKSGFRAGTCFEYSVFNIITQKKLNVKEKPLILMDGFISYDKNKNKKQVINTIIKIIKEVYFYKGSLVLLWHNCSFDNREWKKYNNIYENILNEIEKVKE